MIFIRNLLFIILVLFASAAFAQQNSFNPNDKCGAILSSENIFDDERNALWSYGYIFAQSGIIIPYEKSRIDKLNNELANLCKQAPEQKFISLLDKYVNNLMGEAGTPKQGQKMLEDFVASGKPLAGFIKSLEPRAEDIRAVYKEPLASNLIELYGEMYKSLSGLRMYPEHNAVITNFSTTMGLKNNIAELEKFPKGYAKVLEYFAADFPIATFKFVKLGENLGTSFNGLIFVNNRWVLMPKPWRGLDNE